HQSDPAKAKAGAPEHDFSVLLAHQPRSVFAAARAGFDLQLSGHTHAGQYFPMSLLIYLFQPYVSGLNRHENTQIYVSRGTGYWGPPNRAGSPSEITRLTLERALVRANRAISNGDVIVLRDATTVVVGHHYYQRAATAEAY